MTERLSFTKKLFLMLLLPTAGLLVFSILQVTQKLQTVSAMSKLDDRAKFAISASEVAHELEKENGLSSTFLHTHGAQGGQLQSQRTQTDQAVSSFRQITQSAPLKGSLKTAADHAIQQLSDLSNQRGQVSSLSATPKQATEYYDSTIKSLVGLIGSVADSATTGSVALRLVSLDALVRENELAGKERAMLSALFSAKEVTSIDKDKLLTDVAKQGAFEELFLSHASNEAANQYREKVLGAHTDAVTKFRAIALGAGQQAAPAPAPAPQPAEHKQEQKGKHAKPKDKSSAAPTMQKAPATDPVRGASGAEWWRAATARMNGVAEVQHLVGDQIHQEVSGLSSAASWSLGFFGILALVTILGAVAISWFLARGLIRSFTAASDTLSKVVSQIAGFVQQQSSSTSETASSVTETTTTVEEIRKTAESADNSCKGMTNIAQQSSTASEDALEAVAHGSEAMEHIRSEVESIAQNILELSERNIQIGEIVQSVNAIAEQSNLLAVNASIEAAKAGDHGKGFSVVAAEVKALAQQSKEATDQIRSILGEIQKSSNAAVMITEQGVKRVEEGAALIEELGRAIQNLATAIQQNAEAASQISLITSQQLAGIEQITEAMRNVGIATGQNVEGARNLEEAANEIRTVSSRILEVVQGQRAAA